MTIAIWKRVQCDPNSISWEEKAEDFLKDWSMLRKDILKGLSVCYVTWAF
jgi:hypothetical protein